MEIFNRREIRDTSGLVVIYVPDGESRPPRPKTGTEKGDGVPARPAPEAERGDAGRAAREGRAGRFVLGGGVREFPTVWEWGTLGNLGDTYQFLRNWNMSPIPVSPIFAVARRLGQPRQVPDQPRAPRPPPRHREKGPVPARARPAPGEGPGLRARTRRPWPCAASATRRRTPWPGRPRSPKSASSPSTASSPTSRPTSSRGASARSSRSGSPPRRT